jgi:nicotinamidase-related amidase
LCAVAASAVSLAAKDFVKPAAQPAKAYPAHDDHTDERVAIAADTYDTPDKAKTFSVNFHEHGFLPIFFIVTNDGGQPISIANMQVTLATANRDKLTPASPEDIYRRLTNPRANMHPIPLPIPQKKVKGTISQKERDEIESSQFAAKAVEPHTTQSGFFFFDVEDITAPLAGAHIFVTGVDDAKGTELMYFEIPLEK